MKKKKNISKKDVSFEAFLRAFHIPNSIISGLGLVPIIVRLVIEVVFIWTPLTVLLAETYGEFGIYFFCVILCSRLLYWVWRITKLSRKVN